MARGDPAITSFNGGFYSPLMRGRADYAKYNSGADLLENFIPNVAGPIRRRPGSQFAGALPAGKTGAIFVPFEANSGAAFMLEIGDLYTRIWHAPTRSLVQDLGGGVGGLPGPAPPPPGAIPIYVFYGGCSCYFSKPPQDPANNGSYMLPGYISGCKLFPPLVGESAVDLAARLADGILGASPSAGPYGYMAFGEIYEANYPTHPKSVGRTLPATQTLAESYHGVGGVGFTGQVSTTTDVWFDGVSFNPTDYATVPFPLTNPPSGFFSSSGIAQTLLVGTYIFDTATGLWQVRQGIVDFVALAVEFTALHGPVSMTSDLAFILD